MLGRMFADLLRRRTQRGSADELAQATRLLQLGDAAGAAAACERVLGTDPGAAKAWELAGAAALNLGDYPRACNCFERVLALPGAGAQAYANAAEANRRADRGARALELIEQALALEPDFAAFLHIRVLCLEACWRSEEALAVCRAALERHPESTSLAAVHMTLLNRACADPALVLAAHCRWAERYAGAQAQRLDNPAEPERRLRVGYVSADLREHAVSQFALPMFEHHDAARYEIYCYSNVAKTDAVTRRCESLVAAWRDIVPLDDAAAANMIRADGVDILVDLSGHTSGNRLGVFARKPAPLQITYLGYPATTGLAQMDYRLTDAVADPPGLSEDRYREQLLRLPGSLWCFAPPPQMPEVAPLPARHKGTVTFGSLNSMLKLTPPLVALWSKLLHALPASRLLLVTVPPGEARARIAREFAANGVDASRLGFHGFVSWEEFWRLHAEVDVALDSFPCNGGTTTCETLWLGVPVVSLVGSVFLSRAGLSILNAAGLRELAAESEEEYLRIASGLVQDLPRLAALRASMRERLRASLLFDAARHTREIEDCYRQAWRRWCAEQAC